MHPQMTTSTPEKTLYDNKKGKVRITRTLLEVKGTRYPIRSITKMKLNRSDADAQPIINFIIAACVAAGLGFVFGLPAWILLGALLLLFFILRPLNLEPSYKLTVTTTHGEEIILEPKSTDDMKAMQSALEKAMDMADDRYQRV